MHCLACHTQGIGNGLPVHSGVQGSLDLAQLEGIREYPQGCHGPQSGTRIAGICGNSRRPG